MDAPVPVPSRVKAIYDKACTDQKKDINFGLRLMRFSSGYENDKFEKFNQEMQAKDLRDICGMIPNIEFFNELKTVREKMLDDAGAHKFALNTVWRFVTGLSAGGGLENAGLSLHPIYGFPIIPGSSLKGLSHAWAVMQWLPSFKDDREKLESAWAEILLVFGHGDSPWMDALVKDICRGKLGLDVAPVSEMDEQDRNHAGAVIFHEAWPLNGFPRINVDIINNHHKPYYESAKEFPTDWQSPGPSYFLAVASDQPFRFAVSARDEVAPESDRLVSLAEQWLRDALMSLGAGAKTAAGYGYFYQWSPPGTDSKSKNDKDKNVVEWQNTTLTWDEKEGVVRFKNPNKQKSSCPVGSDKLDDFLKPIGGRKVLDENMSAKNIFVRVSKISKKKFEFIEFVKPGKPGGEK